MTIRHRQVGGVNSHKIKCLDVRNHHKNIKVTNLAIHQIKQEDLDKAKEENRDIPMNNKSVVVIPFSLVFDKRYKDEVTNSTEPMKGLATDINSFAMYASHDLFMSYYLKLRTCPVIRTDIKGQKLTNMVQMYINKRNAYLTELTGANGYDYISNSTDQYNFRSVVNGLGDLNDFREVVMRPYRIINHKMNEYDTYLNRRADSKSYFVFKGGLSLKYMLESLIGDMQCNLDKKNGQLPPNTSRSKRRCNENRQKIFNKINVAIQEDTDFQFHDLSKTYIGQDSENPYFKASDFDTGIYIKKINFEKDYKKISKIVTNVLIDQKDFFDSIWLYNAEKTQDLIRNNLTITQYWDGLKDIKHVGPYSYNNSNIFDKQIEITQTNLEGLGLEGLGSVEAKNRYYKICTDLFFDRIRIITYLLELVPILYDINDGMKRQQHVTKSHVNFLELFDFHKIYEITKKQLFNDVNLDFRTGIINKDNTKLISPLSIIPGGAKYPEHPLQNILYEKYKQSSGPNSIKLRGIPEKRETSKLVYNTSEFVEQCYKEDNNFEINSFFDIINKQVNKTPYYISNNDAINLTRVSETNRQILIKRFGENTANWPTGNTSFGLIRSKLNYKLLMSYNYTRNGRQIQKNYKKDAPGEMIDISIPRPSDFDISSFYGEVPYTNRQNGSYVNYVDLNNYNILDIGTVERETIHGVLRYKITWQNGTSPGGYVSTHLPNDKHIMGLYHDVDSHTAKYKYITSINGVNTLNLNYIIKDTIQMLAFHNLCPWTDPKYKKRLYRVLIVILFKYILDQAVNQNNPTFNTWRKYSKMKLLPIYSKLDLQGVRSCAGILYQEEDEILNKLEEEVVKRWKAILKRKAKIGEKKVGHDDWIDITRTYNLRIYIQNLLKNIGEESNTYNSDVNTTENEFKTLIYKITTLWATQVYKLWKKDKNVNKLKNLDIDIIKNYLFFVLDDTNQLHEKGIISNPNKFFYPRNELIGLLRKSQNEVDMIQPESDRDRVNEVRLRYPKIREYFSKYKLYEKVCDIEENYKTQSAKFKQNIDDICIELYNKYIKNPNIMNLIANMDNVSAEFLKKKYFSVDGNPPEEIKTYRGGKKQRKHRGIYQTGGNKGRLKKGYKYSGKKLKSGLSEIISVKSKRSITNRKR